MADSRLKLNSAYQTQCALGNKRLGAALCPFSEINAISSMTRQTIIRESGS